jgi:hypothetical protein
MELKEGEKKSWLADTGAAVANFGYNTLVGTKNLVVAAKKKRASMIKAASTKKKADALKFCQSTDCASLYNLNAYASLERNLTDVLTHLETVVVPHIQMLTATVRKDRLKYETKRGGRTQVRRRR